MKPFPFPAKMVVTAGLLCGLFAILLASLLAAKDDGGERRQPQPPESSPLAAAAPPSANAAPQIRPNFTMTQTLSDALIVQMRKLQANPNDPDALTAIGEAFTDAGEWAQAESFLERAVTSRPSDKRSLYLLAICRFRLHKTEEAAEAFETLLRIQEDPDALYNLAILYKYHLRQPEKGEDLLRRAALSPDADADLLSAIQKEGAALRKP